MRILMNKLVSFTKSKKTIFTILTLIVTLLIPAIIGIIEIIDWLNPEKAEIIARYDAVRIGFPQKVSNSITPLLMRLQVDTTITNKILTETSLDTKKKELLKDDLKLFQSINYSDLDIEGILKIRIENVGEKPAKNLKIMFPESRRVEIKEQGKYISELNDINHYEHAAMYPGVILEITCWIGYSYYEFKDIIVSHDEGKAKLIKDKNVFYYLYSNSNDFLSPIIIVFQIIFILVLLIWGYYGLKLITTKNKKS